MRPRCIWKLTSKTDWSNFVLWPKSTFTQHYKRSITSFSIKGKAWPPAILWIMMVPFQMNDFLSNCSLIWVGNCCSFSAILEADDLSVFCVSVIGAKREGEWGRCHVFSLATQWLFPDMYSLEISPRLYSTNAWL